MGFDQLKELSPLLQRIDTMQARISSVKALQPDASMTLPSHEPVFGQYQMEYSFVTFSKPLRHTSSN